MSHAGFNNEVGAGGCYARRNKRRLSALSRQGLGTQQAAHRAQLANALGDALLSEVEGGQLYGEALGGHLAREAEATRMLRLVTRLCQILERPEGDLDPQWAETGALRSLGLRLSHLQILERPDGRCGLAVGGGDWCIQHPWDPAGLGVGGGFSARSCSRRAAAPGHGSCQVVG